MNITFQKNAVTLLGTSLKEGEKMPDFTVCDSSLQEVKGSDLSGIRIFAVVPSLDTGVCDLEIKRFNEKATQYPDVKLYAVSLDLPFAQARWCGANGVNAVTTLSDYRDRDFGRVTGTLIQELSLLTRAIFLVDDDNVVRYVEYVPEITDHPDYDTLEQKLNQVIRAQ